MADIQQFVFLNYDALGYPSANVHSLELFRDSVVRPSLTEIDNEIERIRNSDEESADFEADIYADLFRLTVESYLLSVQAMWERGLRKMLVERETKLIGPKQVGAIQKASWSGKAGSLQDRFEQLLGVSLKDFDSYDDLDFLQNLANAIRHGDGQSARRIYDLAPGLWWNWLPPGTTIQAGEHTITMPLDGPTHPSFETITLPQDLLDRLIESVRDFWEDIECMRCNSFRNKHPSTVTMLAKWSTKLETREPKKEWSLW